MALRKGEVIWTAPGSKKAITYSTRSTSDTIAVFAEDGLTFNQALDAINYDPEAIKIIELYITKGYGDIPMKDLGIIY